MFCNDFIKVLQAPKAISQIFGSKSARLDEKDTFTYLILQPYADDPIKAASGHQCAADQVCTGQKADQ